ncbi:hypothetical protein [Paenibacillus naphthalenovorans]|uniref:Uncharacterized protein n=1 Tax=Paenibacillus naphthalenovorans TaxID=162209 RepID=A0A0U2VF09_9BACL|nr:hypothetical protein [Paenibacillus naphthalenovorans]ALS22115.1 hypothetical protein IJ22_17410 [Paenibacillus naphthalenovorans]
MQFVDKLKDFFKYNEGAYYLITDNTGYNTILRVDDVVFETVNTEKFIAEHIGEIEEYFYTDKDYRLDFTVKGKQYFLINYDDGVVSI